ncbi:MAG: recombinase family protein [Bacteriovoracaceae bacterium]|nr:recombinase family protein [Bacteriovoracaceae bacterium]
MAKINDLSNSVLRKKYFDTTFVPENNLTILSVRVSGKKQERGQSFAEQLQISETYIKKENLHLIKMWKVAESASKDHVRKHFHAMLAFIKESQKTLSPIKHIVFSFQSRSNRNKKSARELEELVEMGITLHFARDNRKLTCKSDFPELMMWHMENIKNEIFIKEMTQNSMGGTIQCIEQGMTPVAVPPYGLKSVGEKDTRRWIPDGDKAEFVKR